MNKHKFSLWRLLVLAMAMLAVPMAAAAAAPPPAPANPLYPPGIGWNPVVNYALPNFAQSPNIRKFVDSLPGVGFANRNNLGQYIPLATPDTTTFAGDATSSAANPKSDYYEIELKQYNQQMHSDLPIAGTTLRGYAQVNDPTGTVNGVHQYLGPLVIAKSYDPSKPAGLNGNGKPVRIKFFNRLPTGAAGNLPLPVDTTIMGAGTGPNLTTELYTQNRATLHLHGGATPWISDGTPHQWITPALETTSYPKGLSFQNVPDMVTGSGSPCHGTSCFGPTTTDGIGTFYYTNEQSARLMFYHDHAYGTTRLNVYDGMAAGYLLTDQYEEDMISGTNVYGANPTNAKILPDLGGVYHYGIPLVIQDKSFVNDVSTPSAAAVAAFPATGYTPTSKTLATDPLWGYYTPPYAPPGTPGGNLWFPHEYLPVENPFDPTGNTWNGRWDYSPFMIPPGLPLGLTLPSPTIIPEGFMDTAVVNGTAFPYAVLPPDAIRFRILNACNDRTLNLQLYYAKDKITGNICKAGNAFTVANCTEVSMVDAAPNAAFPTWPIDGRDGGVPDPTTAGPPWIQIGNEGGFLAKVAVTPQQPVDFEYNRQNIPLAGVTGHALLLLPAVRADVIVDLSGFRAGDVVIVYNDAPAPMPNFWPINDYYSDDPDNRGTGGAPTTPPGFGPNTRTIMQIRIAGTKTSSFNFHSDAKPGFVRGFPSVGSLPAIETPGTDGPSLAALKAALPQVFAVSQDPPLVPQLAYNLAFPSGPHHFAGANDNYVVGYQTTLNISGTASGLSRILTTGAGNNYLKPPTVILAGGFPAGCVAPTCVNATATAGLNPIGAVTLLTTGSGYLTTPTVTLGPPDALIPPAVTSVQATAMATVSGGAVNAITIDEPGAGYTNTVTAPTCTVSAPNTPPLPGDVTATCEVLLPTLNTVGSIVLNTPGSGYTRQPEVFLVPAAGDIGLGATSVAMLPGDLPMTGKNLTEGFDVEFGRMDVRLGSTPNPLTPSVGAGFVLGLARYIDPPTEIMNDGETIIWRLSHLGVDSHAMHFHLFNLQVVNRVDWTNVLKPPYPDEIGWKETIRTNPMEDLIVAIRPKSQVLPFTIPSSNRLLDVTTPLNSTINFYPVAPPAGIPAVAQQSNVMTNFGWEYVWHCHLLGHEENDMMRPMVLVLATAVPPTPGRPTATATAGQVVLVWTEAATTPVNAPTGYLVQRATGAGSIVFSNIAMINDKTVLTYTDTSVAPATTYRYQIVAFNGFGNSPASPIRNATTPAGPTITTATLPGGTNGVAYNQPLAATGGATPYTWAVTAGALPTGLTLSSAGTISGTPTAVGTFNFTVQVTDNAAATATKPLSIIINLPVAITTATLPAGTVGVAYSQPLAATNGFTPYSWAVTAGALPTGLTLSAAGVISGTPTTVGTSNFTVSVTDAVSGTATKALSIAVIAPTITTATLPGGIVGLPYSQPLAATSGTPPYIWAVTAGALPTGLTLSAAGVISGTPTTVGTFNFTVRVTDAVGGTATKALSIIVVLVPSITTATLPDGTYGVAYSQPLAATGGTPPYTWAVTAGALPVGLTLSSAGVISGTPTLPATYNFTVTVTDAAAVTATKALSITVAAAAGSPTVPTGLTAKIASATQITLTWTDASNNETSFAVWSSVNGAAFTQVGTTPTRTAAQRTGTGGTVTFTNTGRVAGNTYTYFVTAVNAAGPSVASNTVSVVFTVPTAPSGLTGAAVAITGNTTYDKTTLNWTDNSNTETLFTIQRATDAAFTVGVASYSVTANVITFSQNDVRRTTPPTNGYFWRVRATNSLGNSTWTPGLFVATP